MDQACTTALNRLLLVACSDTGQSRRVADFLLSWWNAATCGKWDPTDLWALDYEISEDILMLLRGIDTSRSYPDTLGYKAQFDRLVREWRPHLLKE
jgi:hypothetical protein